MATMSLLGLYNYNDTIFDNLAIPEGIDKNTLINNLLAETAELEILYASAEFMKNMIKVWSMKELPVWQKLYNTTMLKYDPISNYDRKEEETNAVKNKSDFASSGSNNNLSKVAAFNESALQPSDSSEGNSSAKGAANANTDAIRKLRAYGNIGVTTTQHMIEEERKVVEFNIYDYIIDSFKRRFCLLVY